MEMMELMKRLHGCTRKLGNDRRKLNHMLKKAGIEFEWHNLYDGYQWTFAQYPCGDVAIHGGTYGSHRGHVESYCMPWDDGDVTELTKIELITNLTKGK